MFYRCVFALSQALLLLFQSGASAQERDTVRVLDPVVVSGIRVSTARETSLNIRSMSVAQMRQSGAFNISDALAKLPGINQLNTGVAISKPVIRGLYGNRVLAVLSGLKFDNQQWQDEHGLGLNDVGIDRVEVIKGPASLLYGSEAIGGILNIIEEAPAAPGTKSGDLNIGMFSNTYGVSLDGGIKSATATRSHALRVGISSHADYTDGHDHRIVNSRFAGYYIKASMGFRKKNWNSLNHFSSSLDNFGFITADNSNSFHNDGRLSRSMKGPHHTVLLNVLSSENTIALKTSKLNVNAGLQSNLRLEDEGGGSISLSMLLSSLLWRVAWEKSLDEKTTLIISNNSQLQNNTNLGSRIIIPDAWMAETGFSAFVRRKNSTVVLEAGLGASLRNIHTLLTDQVNTPGKAIPPFNKTKPSINGSAGLAWNPNTKWNIKTNVGTGFRSGNLAELSSDGLHEGTLRYEIGDDRMKYEQNINTESSVSFSSAFVQFSVAGFWNHFRNYIYLAPTGTQFLGFDVFHYRQFDADLYGTEAMFGLRFPFYERLRWETNLSTVTGKLTDGTYLPFIPPAKWTHELRWTCRDQRAVKNLSVFILAEDHISQQHPALFESATAAYWLLNAGISGGWETKNRTFTFSIAGNNLFDKQYYDHLSRFKDYGIHNIGRNIVLHLAIPFFIQSSKKIQP